MKRLLDLDDEPDSVGVRRLFEPVIASAAFGRTIRRHGDPAFEARLRARLADAGYRTTPFGHPGYATVAADSRLLLGLSGAVLAMERRASRLAARGPRGGRIARPLQVLARHIVLHELVHACQEASKAVLTAERNGRSCCLRTPVLEGQAFRAGPASLVVLAAFIAAIMMAFVIGLVLLLWLVAGPAF